MFTERGREQSAVVCVSGVRMAEETSGCGRALACGAHTEVSHVGEDRGCGLEQ